MSERSVQPTDAAKVGWRTSGSGQPISEPAGSKRADGWAYKEILPADEHNWQINLNGALHLWLQGFVNREWSELPEAIAATSPPQHFWVHQPSGGQHFLNTEIFNLKPASFSGTIRGIASDGQRIYGIDSSNNLVAIDPTDGSELWNVTTVNTSAQFARPIACDGLNVYLSGNVTSKGLVRYDPTDGSEDGRAGTMYAASHIAANGEYALLAGGTGFPSRLYFYDTLGGTPNEIGYVNLGSGETVRGLAIDREYAFVAYQNTSPDASEIKCYKLSDQTLVWTFDLTPIVDESDARINDIWADGEFLYVATEYLTHTADASPVNLFVLGRAIGDEVEYWNAQPSSGATNDLLKVTGDGHHLFVTYDGSPDGVLALALRGLAMNLLWTGGDLEVYDSDGISVIGLETTGNKVRRLRSADQAVLFQRANPDDPNRRPFHNLAIPVVR